jgi:hypothetical protein
VRVAAPIRVVALVGLLAALAIGAWTFVLGQKGTTGAVSTSSEAVGSVGENPIAAAQSAASKLNAHNKGTAGKPDAVQTSPKRATPTHLRKAKPVKSPGETPTTIAGVLRHHKVAVVLLYDPQSKVNALSLGETQLGANRAHAGFLRVNVLKARQSAPFATTYGVLQVPTVLFFARPGKLVQKLVGFQDQDTVAQAALNAARGLVAPQQ